MTPPSPPAPPKYAWPKYVLAGVLLFLFVAVVWTYKEVKKLQRARDASQDQRPIPSR